MVLALVLLVVIVLSIGEEGSDAGSDAPEMEVRSDRDSNIELVPATIHEEGWETPRKLPFNDEGWEDSPYLTRDGKQLLFFYHPWPDLAVPEVVEKATEIVVTDPERAVREGIDGKIYVSDYPFTGKRVHPISSDSSPASECCPYLSKSGELFYGSTREAFEKMKDVPTSIYVDGRRLDIKTGGSEDNPHYCDALDELWFDCPGDTNICVMKDAKKKDYRGVVERAPYPINVEGSQNFQPFLTDDCNTLYFSSTRGDGQTIAIYRSERRGDGGWTEPVLFVSHPAGVAELSMTSDGRAMAFAQLFWREDGTPGIDIWYSERVSE